MKHRDNTVRAVVLAALPATQADIHAKTGVSQAAISRWITYLRACGDAHIGSWRERASKFGLPMAVYHPGPGLNVACDIKPMTQKQRDRRSRAVRRKTGDWVDRQARERSRYWAAKPARRDSLTAALFGAA
jgi:hypothetical protein